MIRQLIGFGVVSVSLCLFHATQLIEKCTELLFIQFWPVGWGCSEDLWWNGERKMDFQLKISNMTGRGADGCPINSFGHDEELEPDKSPLVRLC